MDYEVSRRKMVEEQLVARGISDPKVLEVMGRLPRHLFVDPGLASQAYEDHPLNIGSRQTISQPYMVALMTSLLELRGGERVMEIGTGSGYQTAVLAELCRGVWTVERVAPLSNRARKNLYAMATVNVHLRIGDGTLGWPEEAPFDGILVTAASREIPPPYREQLAEGGRIVIPLGDAVDQVLVRVVKTAGRFHQEEITGCRFVKLVGQYGWREAEEEG